MKIWTKFPIWQPARILKNPALRKTKQEHIRTERFPVTSFFVCNMHYQSYPKGSIYHESHDPNSEVFSLWTSGTTKIRDVKSLKIFSNLLTELKEFKHARKKNERTLINLKKKTNQIEE